MEHQRNADPSRARGEIPRAPGNDPAARPITRRPKDRPSLALPGYTSGRAGAAKGESMPFKRPGSRVWQIRVNGVRQSSGTTDHEAAKALEHKLNHQAWE